MPRAIQTLTKIVPAVQLLVDISDVASDHSPEAIAATALFLAVYHQVPQIARPYINFGPGTTLPPPAGYFGAFDPATLAPIAAGVPATRQHVYMEPGNSHGASIAALTAANPAFGSFYAANAAALNAMVAELTTVSAKKRITRDNFKSLLLSVNMPSAVVGVFDRILMILPFSTAVLAPAAPVSVWASYHLTATSTVHLVNKYLAEFPEGHGHVCTAAEVNRIRNADPENYQHNISDNVIAHAFCYLRASKFDFGNWYQGNKAISNMPAAFKSSKILFYQRYLDIKNSAEAITSCNDLATLVQYFQGAITATQLEVEVQKQKNREAVRKQATTTVVQSAVAALTGTANGQIIAAAVAQMVNDIL